jgi:hypothetical protein
MATAVKGIPNESALGLDFFDRTRMATWVRDHQGLVPWVRMKARRPITGCPIRPAGGLVAARVAPRPATRSKKVPVNGSVASKASAR